MDDHYRNLETRLGSLRGVFSSDPAGTRFLELFDELLSENEFDSALHALCDFLLEPSVASCDQATLNQIESLHQQMRLNDDCADKLRKKKT